MPQRQSRCRDRPRHRGTESGTSIAGARGMQQHLEPSQRSRSPSAPASTGTAAHRWSGRVTRESDALDLEQGVFLHGDANAVARSLKDSADKSKRRKAEPYRSAMSMLVFYINRAGRNLPKAQRKVLEQAKDELRRLYGRPLGRAARRAGAGASGRLR
jgi:hypothetical protein